MNNKKLSLIAAALVSAASFAQAEETMISGVTVYTGAEQGIVENANVVIEDGKIMSVTTGAVAGFSGNVVDGKGKVLTPGFIAAMNNMGLVEVGAVSSTRDASDDKADITFDPSIAFNPYSTVIPFGLKGGVTHSVVRPGGGKDMFKGQGFVVEHTGEMDSVIDKETFTYASVGSSSSGSRATSLLSLLKKLEEQQKKIEEQSEKKDDDKDKAKEPSKEEKLFAAILKGEKPLVVSANRHTDLLHLIHIKKRFNIDLVISGAADAMVVKSELAEAGIPIIMNPMANRPGSFDSLNNSLSNAGELARAGVKIMFSGGTHSVEQLRYDAGNAISNGMSIEDAVKAVSTNIASTFGMNSGTVEVGKDADLVLWSADPFEFSTKVDKVWIDGEEVSTQTRMDKLRDRYTTSSEMPRGYTK